MARDITTATKTQSVAAKRATVYFAFFDFKSGPVRVWTGVGNVTWDGNTYLGLGEFGTVTGLGESAQTLAGGPTFQLSGAPSALIAIAFADNYNGRAVKAWFGFRNLATDAIIADPYAIFQGRMEKLEIDPGPQKSTIRIYAESKNYAPNQADDRRYNAADQQIDFPGDTGLDLMASSGQRSINWGDPGQNIAPGAGRGGGGGLVDEIE